MKAKVETSSELYNRGIELESETDEEKQVLEQIWTGRGRPVVLARVDDSNVLLVVAPTLEEEP